MSPVNHLASRVADHLRAVSLFRTEKPFVPVPLTETDRLVSTVAFGFTIGFSVFVTMNAYSQTRRVSVYTVLIWSEIVACLVFACICWAYLNDFFQHSFAFYFSILTCWALQVQFLLQIIVNRTCLLLRRENDKFWLKTSTAVFITAINITVYCIWIPAKLQISQRYHDINVWWDRCEKVMYLITDGLLNWLFIRTVDNRLLSVGLTKYDKLVIFNKRIIFISLSMDVLIIGMMSYPNDFVYMQFHPVAYIIKLQIELVMSRLIVKVARGTGVTVIDNLPNSSERNTGNTGSGSASVSANNIVVGHPGHTHSRSGGHVTSSIMLQPVNVHVGTDVVVKRDPNEIEEEEEDDDEVWNTKRDATSTVATGDDETRQEETHREDQRSSPGFPTVVRFS